MNKLTSKTIDVLLNRGNHIRVNYFVWILLTFDTAVTWKKQTNVISQKNSHKTFLLPGYLSDVVISVLISDRAFAHSMRTNVSICRIKTDPESV